MTKFDEFLANFRYNPETFNDEEFKSAAKAAYDQDQAGWNATLTEREQAAAELAAKNTKLAAENWRLFTQTGTPIPPNNASGSQVPPAVEEDPNEPELKGTSSFFSPIESKE